LLTRFDVGATGDGNWPVSIPAVIRQQMGHTSAAMTRLYTGEIPLEHVQAEFSSKNGNRIVVLENMENEAAA
jgi:hypothetical protein